MSAIFMHRQTTRLVTSLHLHSHSRLTACPHSIFNRLSARTVTTSAVTAPPPPLFSPYDPLSLPNNLFTSSSSSSSSTPPPRPPRSTPLRYLIVSAASLAVGAMLASVAEPLQQLNTLRTSQQSLATLLQTTHTPPPLPASAPAWATALATDSRYDYKDVTSVFPTTNHLIYDSLRADKKVQHVYHFISKQQQQQQSQHPEPEHPEVRVLFELGSGLCGHTGIIHGGLTASLIDQISGETAFLSTGPGSFTANLNVNYLKPLIAGRWVEVVGRVVGVEGRKIRVRVEVADGGAEGSEQQRVVYATGDVLFVRPKWIPEQTSEWKISASSVQREQDKEKQQTQQQQQNMLKSG